MKLSNRLKVIADCVVTDSIVADIGTDHGYIPQYLIENGISKKVIATDISYGSLQKTKDIVLENNLEAYIETRLGDGLNPINQNEVDTVIVAGMGGLLIRDILIKNSSKLDTFRNYIFQPMVAASELREYLNQNGFIITKEELSKEGDKFYEIIVAKRGEQPLFKSNELLISPLLLAPRHILFDEFIESKMSLVQKIIDEVKTNKTDRAKIRLEELMCEKRIYEEYLK